MKVEQPVPDAPGEPAKGAATSKSPRKSLTKSQLETPEALELLALLQTVTEDGHLLDEEIGALRQWLEDNAASQLPAVAHLRVAVTTALADGRVSAEERAWLQKSIETVMPREHRELASVRRREALGESKAEAREFAARLKAEAREAADRRRPVARFDFMVAGASFEGRPKAIRSNCRVDDFVHLVREYGNAHSRHAILVRLQTEEEIGYVPEIEAQRLAPLLDRGAVQSASLKKVLTGRRSPIPIVWGELYGADSGVAHAQAIGGIQANETRRVHAERGATEEPTTSSAWKWIVAAAAAAALASALV